MFQLKPKENLEFYIIYKSYEQNKKYLYAKVIKKKIIDVIIILR